MKTFSITPSWDETMEKIRKQGYVYIKLPTNNGKHWVTKEEVNLWNNIITFYRDITICQENYGSKFALTREELE